MFKRVAVWLFALVLIVAPPAWPQGLGGGASIPKPSELIRTTVAPALVPAGGSGQTDILVQVLAGWHVNANPPAIDYLIPTQLEVEDAAGIHAGAAVYPPPKLVQFSFEAKPLAVYDGAFVIHVPLQAAAGATGTHELKGTLRFQSCNDQLCLPPAVVPVTIAVEVGPPGTAVTDTTRHTSGTGFVTQAPSGAAAAPAIDNPVGRMFERGGWLAYLGLFLMGLALNLTPCVYPMMGVTLSIFGARGQAPLRQVITLAVVYVLGISAMYSTLGLVAAFTGGLFGGFLQSPWVLGGIGVLLIGMALSMFGLYQLQAPAALLDRLGGSATASVASVFVSGLVVGVFAAPCIGPPVVALLALVAAKGDPGFGFLSFFVLSLGLGAPYLVLASSSHLIQRLPRSGEWMVWMERVFGVILAGVGGFYLLLAFAPRVAPWIIPATLILGGIYLGFVEGSGRGKPAFTRWKRVVGALAILAGVFVVATPAGSGVAFADYTPEALEQAAAGRQPVLIDFSAAWCVPCHELERVTFTDRRVIASARRFRTLKVDLTHFDSPASDSMRRRFQIAGVPTLLFLDGEGREVRDARIEGFVPPEVVLGSMERVR